MRVSESPRIDLHNTDCIAGMAAHLNPGSVHLAVFSPPFEELFTYSGKPEDVGNNGSTIDIREGRFALNMRFVVEQLYRVLAPGCNVCVHIQQLLAYKVQHGFMGRRDFRGATVDIFTRGGSVATHATLADGTPLPIVLPELNPAGEGFRFVGEFVIPKNPQALRDGSKVLTPTGWKVIESLVVGDLVIGSDGRPTSVRGVYRHEPRQLYRVQFADGTSVECDGNHLWQVGTKQGQPRVMTTDQIREFGVSHPSGAPRFFIPIISAPAELEAAGERPIDPYTLGALLGDGGIGTRSSAYLSCEHEIVATATLPPRHRWRRVPGTTVGGGTVATYAAVGPDKRRNVLLDGLRDIGVHGLRAWEKHVPDAYLFAPPAVRLEVLRGLMDTDGCIKTRNGIVAKFTTTSRRLADDVAFLAQSLGGVSRIRGDRGGVYTYAGERRRGRDKWEVSLRMPPGMNPFRYSRKADRWKPTRKKVSRHIVSIESTVVDNCTCIEVDAHDQLYVTEHCIVTHNTMAQRLNLHSLQFKTGYARNSCNLAPAVNDYVLIFQKPGQHPCPPRALRHDQRNPGGWVTQDEWIHWASGDWNDIIEIDVLDGARGHKEEKQEKHVCPLQLELIRRLVELYTNPVSVQPDVLVLDPFMGIGSTAFVCAGGASPVTKLKLHAPRNVVGFELKESYHRASLAYVRKVLKAREKAAKAVESGSLLDMVGVGDAA